MWHGLRRTRHSSQHTHSRPPPGRTCERWALVGSMSIIASQSSMVWAKAVPQKSERCFWLADSNGAKQEPTEDPGTLPQRTISILGPLVFLMWHIRLALLRPDLNDYMTSLSLRSRWGGSVPDCRPRPLSGTNVLRDSAAVHWTAGLQSSSRTAAQEPASLQSRIPQIA